MINLYSKSCCLAILAFIFFVIQVAYADENDILIVIKNGEIIKITDSEGNELSLNDITRDHVVETSFFEKDCLKLKVIYKWRKNMPNPTQGSDEVIKMFPSNACGNRLIDREERNIDSDEKFRNFLKSDHWSKYGVKKQNSFISEEKEFDEILECKCKPNFVDLKSFKISSSESSKVVLNWISGIEVNNVGFRVWRGKGYNSNSYTDVTMLTELNYVEVEPSIGEDCSRKIQGQLKEVDVDRNNIIYTIGNSLLDVCYSFTDITTLDEGTYYYLLEDFDHNGKSTFHCDHIDAITINQGAMINLEAATVFCKQQVK